MKIILRKTGEKGYLKSIEFAVDWKKLDLLLQFLSLSKLKGLL
jgi:hypothetical protein